MVTTEHRNLRSRYGVGRVRNLGRSVQGCFRCNKTGVFGEKSRFRLFLRTPLIARYGISLNHVQDAHLYGVEKG
jgi:hypothetical protein